MWWSGVSHLRVRVELQSGTVLSSVSSTTVIHHIHHRSWTHTNKPIIIISIHHISPFISKRKNRKYNSTVFNMYLRESSLQKSVFHTKHSKNWNPTLTASSWPCFSESGLMRPHRWDIHHHIKRCWRTGTADTSPSIHQEATSELLKEHELDSQQGHVNRREREQNRRHVLRPHDATDLK